MNTYTKPLALVSSILLTASLAGPSQAAPTDQTPTQNLQTVDNPITAPDVHLPNEEPKVGTIAAPKFASQAEPVVVEDAVPAVSSAPATPAPAPTPVAVTPKVVEPAPKVSASGKGATIAAAAYAQIGVPQDCTALATNALAAAGVNFHGWPAGYLSLGPTVSAAEAQAGDLAYYQDGGMGMAHIAVYVGNGQAIHGGWNGGTTVLHSVNVGSGPVFIRVA